jgi:hypothetical protein
LTGASSRKEQGDQGLASLIGSGAELVGSTLANAAIGLVTGGTAGALAGAAQGAVGPLFANGLRPAAQDLAARYLSHREEVRVGAAVAMAAEAIQERLDSGEKPRIDNFFEWNADERPAATEVAEGILRVCQQDHEEKKLPYTSRLLTSFYFAHFIDRGYANILIRMSERLRWRQLVILAILAEKDRYSLRQGDFRGDAPRTQFVISVLYDIFDLYSMAR